MIGEGQLKKENSNSAKFELMQEKEIKIVQKL